MVTKFFSSIIMVLLLAAAVPYFAEAAQAAQAAQAAEKAVKYVDVDQDDPLNVRTGPSASSKKIAQLERGTKVTVLSGTGTWVKVSSGDIEGYVNSTYLSTEKPGNASFKTKAISVAKSQLGTKYKWGGISPSGFDCSGLVKYSFGKAGKVLPRTAAAMYQKGSKVKSLQTGDLMFFAPNNASRPTHVSIYIGGGQMIQSATSKGVSIASISNSYWKPRYIGAKRL